MQTERRELRLQKGQRSTGAEGQYCMSTQPSPGGQAGLSGSPGVTRVISVQFCIRTVTWLAGSRSSKCQSQLELFETKLQVHNSFSRTGDLPVCLISRSPCPINHKMPSWRRNTGSHFDQPQTPSMDLCLRRCEALGATGLVAGEMLSL